jgi:hypothetical protein
MSDNNKKILEAEDLRLKLSAEAIQSMKGGQDSTIDARLDLRSIEKSYPWRLLT